MLYEEAPIGHITFVIITIGYGVIGIGCLITAWIKKQNYSKNTLQFISIAIVALYFLTSIDAGIISEMEWAANIVVTLLSFSNWLIVRKITNQKKTA